MLDVIGRIPHVGKRYRPARRLLVGVGPGSKREHAQRDAGNVLEDLIAKN